MKPLYYLYLFIFVLVVGGCFANSKNGLFSNEVFSSKTKLIHVDKRKDISNGEITNSGIGTESSEVKSETNPDIEGTPHLNILTDIEYDDSEFPLHQYEKSSLIEKGHDKERQSQISFDEALDLIQISQEYWQKGNPDESIEALDQAYFRILNVKAADESDMMQQKEDLRFVIAKRLLEIYASRNIATNGNYSAIPLVVNKYVQKEINLFTTGREKKFFIAAYRRSGRYRPQIIKELRKAGLPERLSWLPLIESGFKPKALSRSRALGLWQFIPSTGYKFGLKRDKYIDERLDPEKSTQAAIDYMKELHTIFGDWSTVLAAYNCGEGRVLKIIRSQNINYLDNFWDLFKRLPRETARYVPRFFATLHIVDNLEKYNLDNIPVDQPLEFDTVKVHKKSHLRDIAKNTGIRLSLLQELNPELRFQILPGANYSMRVPKGSGALLLSKIDKIPAFKIPKRAFIYHRIQPGETLGIIAKRYNTSVGRITRENNLKRSSYIVAGKTIRIPRKKKVKTKIKTERINHNSSQGLLKHVVREGDSLWIIAKKYGTSIKIIKGLNHLTSDNLYVGQVLIISKEMRRVSKNSGLRTYVVQPGDNPSLIAKQHRMELERLLDLNRLYPRSKIFPGQRLYVE